MSKSYNLTVNEMAATPKAYNLSTAEFHSNNGLVVDIKELIKDIKIIESLYSSSLTVKIFLLDSIALIDYLKFSGSEKISLVINRKDVVSQVNKNFILDVFVSEVRDLSTPSPSSKAYTLFCVSKHAYLNTIKVVKRAFNNTPSELIRSIVKSELDSDIDIRNESTTPIKGIYPRIRPLSAIAWLMRNAYENAMPNYFYETAKSGLIFNSYSKMMNSDVYDTYNNNPNFTSESINTIEELYTEERLKIQKVLGQTLNLSKYNAANRGAFGSTLYPIDIYNKNKDKVTYGYNNPEKMEMLNTHAPINELIKIDGAEYNTYKDSKNYFISYNSGAYDNKKNYHAPTNQSLLQAEAYIHNLDTVKQELLLTGDFDLECGMVIDLNLLKAADITEEMLESEDFKDHTLSGKHLVTGIVHHLSSDGYFMNVTAKKDSFIKELKGLEDNVQTKR